MKSTKTIRLRYPDTRGLRVRTLSPCNRVFSHGEDVVNERLVMFNGGYKTLIEFGVKLFDDSCST